MKRFKEPVYVRQEVLFLKEWYQPGCVPKARNVPMLKSPDRVWTLYTEMDENKPPTLPFKPIHNFNAFLEDYTHDWNWRLVRRDGKMIGEFDFYSRVVDRPVWVLLEFKK